MTGPRKHSDASSPWAASGRFALTAAIPEGLSFDPEMDVGLLAMCFD
jgi:hypothetical protein